MKYLNYIHKGVFFPFILILFCIIVITVIFFPINLETRIGIIKEAKKDLINDYFNEQ